MAKKRPLDEPAPISCVLVMAKHQALELANLLEQERVGFNPSEWAFDDTVLGGVLRALKGDGKVEMAHGG